jgi:hypothetical protein
MCASKEESGVSEIALEVNGVLVKGRKDVSENEPDELAGKRVGC